MSRINSLPLWIKHDLCCGAGCPGCDGRGRVEDKSRVSPHTRPMTPLEEIADRANAFGIELVTLPLNPSTEELLERITTLTMLLSGLIAVVGATEVLAESEVGV